MKPFFAIQYKKKIWLIGLINTPTKYFRIEEVTERTTNNIEKIIRHNISECNNIITDDITSSNWLNNGNSGYNHIIHIHLQNDFGHGEESTSYIEFVWADLKRMLQDFILMFNLKTLLFL